MSGGGPFGASRACFEDVAGWLEGSEAASLSHAELEGLDRRGRDLLRRLLQDHLDLRAAREHRAEVVGADGAAHGSVEVGHTHTRQLATVFGAVRVERLAYRRRGAANLHPADGALNLPAERHSHGLRHLAAVESSRGSFGDAVEAIERATGQHVGSARSRSSPHAPQPMSTRTTTRSSGDRPTTTTYWSCPATARVDTPARCAPPPSPDFRR